MLVPKLRFKEFNNAWKKTKLENISNIFDGTHQTPNYKKSGVKFVSVENIDNIKNPQKYISIKDFEKNFKVKPQKDDILMTRITAGIIGATAVVEDNEPLGYYVSLALIRKIDNVDINFLNQNINSQMFKRELNKRIIHVAFPKKINLSDIGKCELSITNIDEQQKIGEFLNLMDKKIELQQKKIEALKMYKKGLMSKVFENSKNSKITKLKDICMIEKGKQLNQEKMINNGKYYVLNGGSELSGYTDSYNTDENTISISEGGNSCGFVNYNIEKFWAGGHCYVLKNIVDNINKEYLFQILKYNQERIMKLRVGSGLPNIQKKSIENFEIKIFEVEHQRYLAQLLNKIDYKIAVENKRYNSLLSIKKSLLQQMFT